MNLLSSLDRDAKVLGSCGGSIPIHSNNHAPISNNTSSRSSNVFTFDQDERNLEFNQPLNFFNDRHFSPCSMNSPFEFRQRPRCLSLSQSECYQNTDPLFLPEFGRIAGRSNVFSRRDDCLQSPQCRNPVVNSTFSQMGEPAYSSSSGLTCYPDDVSFFGRNFQSSSSQNMIYPSYPTTSNSFFAGEPSFCSDPIPNFGEKSPSLSLPPISVSKSVQSNSSATEDAISPSLSHVSSPVRGAMKSAYSKVDSSVHSIQQKPRKGGRSKEARHNNVSVSPTSTELPNNVVIEDVMNKSDKRTTMMIKNIPNAFSRETLLKIIDAYCKNKYDFFYLPIDQKTNCNLGYGYINMIDIDSVVCLYNEFHGKKWANTRSVKVCSICYGRLQSETENLVQYCSDWSVMTSDEKYHPLFFKKTMYVVDGDETVIMERYLPEQNIANFNPVVKEVFSSLSKEKQTICNNLGNLYSIVVTLDALLSANRQGHIADDMFESKKKSLLNQFESSMLVCNSDTSKEQFFKDYFDNDEFRDAKNVLLNTEKETKRLRDSVGDAYYSLMGYVNGNKTKQNIKLGIEAYEKAIETYLKSVKVSFDYMKSVDDMLYKLEERECEDNENVEKNIATAIGNIAGELNEAFKNV